MIPDVKKSAIKISDMFADSRMDNDDIDRIALMVVLYSRKDEILERLDYFCNRFYYHQSTVDIAKGSMDLTAALEKGTL